MKSLPSSKLAQTVFTCSQEDPRSSISQNTDSPDWCFLWFFSVPPKKFLHSTSIMSRDSSVGIAMICGLEDRISIPGKARFFIFSIESRPALGLTKPLIQGVPGTHPGWVKLPVHEVITHNPLKLRSRIVDLYLHCPMCLHGVVSNYIISTRITLFLVPTTALFHILSNSVFTRRLTIRRFMFWGRRASLRNRNRSPLMVPILRQINPDIVQIK
jgi:hypothetical protein